MYFDRRSSIYSALEFYECSDNTIYYYSRKLVYSNFEGVVTSTPCEAVQVGRFRSDSFESKNIGDDINLFIDVR